MPPPPLYLDEDMSVVVAAMLRARGFDVVTARDVEQLGQPDAEQLAFAAGNTRILVTHNRADFARLHGAWVTAGQRHGGIVIARRRLPRELTARVGRLLSRVPSEHFSDQLFFI